MADTNRLMLSEASDIYSIALDRVLFADDETSGRLALHHTITSHGPAIHRHKTTYAPFYRNEETSTFILFQIPKIIFRWLYSFSLLLLCFFTLLLLAVSPIDVIAQTSSTSASFSGVKVFIVIIVCVLYVLVSIGLYLLRILQNRVQMNEIPLKSVYVLGKDDMPKRPYKYICEKWEKLMEILDRAGPLRNKHIIINYPGISPSQYIQDRNLHVYNSTHRGEQVNSCTGSVLPPDSCYEDILRSIGDKFKLNGRILTQIDLPKNLSFREILIYIFQIYESGSEFNATDMPNIQRLIELYERMTFGPDLIEEADILEFMIEFEKLVVYCTTHYDGELAYKPKSAAPSLRRGYYDTSNGSNYYSNSDRRYSASYSKYLYTDDRSRRDSVFLHPPVVQRSGSSDGDSVNDRDPVSGRSDGASSSRLRRSTSYKSVVMKRLAINRKDYREDDDPDFNRDRGYDSDNEGEVRMGAGAPEAAPEDVDVDDVYEERKHTGEAEHSDEEEAAAEEHSNDDYDEERSDMDTRVYRYTPGHHTHENSPLGGTDSAVAHDNDNFYGFRRRSIVPDS